MIDCKVEIYFPEGPKEKPQRAMDLRFSSAPREEIKFLLSLVLRPDHQYYLIGLLNIIIICYI